MEHHNEHWLPVVGFEGQYEISDLGRVRSLDRKVPCRGGSTRLHRGRVLQPGNGSYNHQVVCLSGRRMVQVHRLVLEAFIGKCPDGMEACHNNDVADDNRLVNLRWDTRTANEHDKLRNNGHYRSKWTHCKNGHEFTSENTILRVLNNRTYRHCRECARLRGRIHMRQKRKGKL